MGTRERLFNAIAPIYGLFFNHQVNYYQRVLARVKPLCDPSAYKSVIDIGCGTGALSYVLHSLGMEVTGIDSAEKMLAVAKRKLAQTDIQLARVDIHRPTPFPAKSFDVAISAYTAHGMEPGQRQKMYREMNRLARYRVIFHDYNKNRTLLTDIIEGLEGGDYFNFIAKAAEEMAAQFQRVTVVDVTGSAAWYVCSPFD